MINKSTGRFGDTASASLQANIVQRKGFDVYANYKTEGLGPLVVSDPEQVAHLVNKYDLDVHAVTKSDLIWKGLMWVKDFTHRIPDNLKRYFEPFISGGNHLWTDYTHNVTCQEGRVYMLETFFAGSAYTADPYLVLFKDAGAFSASATATYASPGTGYTELTTDVSDATRVAYTPDTADNGTGSDAHIDNETSKTAYTINATVTVHGAALVTGNSTKGDATSNAARVMVSQAAFTTPRSATSGDTVTTEIDFTLSNA